MLEPLGNLIRRWRADPRPATTLALCQSLAEVGEASRSAPPAGWPEYIAFCGEVGRVVGERFALDLDVLLAAGRMHLAAGATWDAQAATLQAAKIAPDEPRAWAMLGEALLRRGDASRAARSLERAAGAAVRFDLQLLQLAQDLSHATHASREAIADEVARSLGYAAQPSPPGVPSMPPGASPSSIAPRPHPVIPRPASVPRLLQSRPDVPMAPGAEESGEATVRHEFDRDELYALLRASDGAVASAADDPRANEALARLQARVAQSSRNSERASDLDDSQTSQFSAKDMPRPQAPPVPPLRSVLQSASDVFTLVRRANLDDDATTETENIPTSVGQASPALLAALRAANIPLANIPLSPRSSAGSLDEVVPTIARALAPRSMDHAHHPMVEDPTTDHPAFRDELTSDDDAFPLARPFDPIIVPRAPQPLPPPAARVIVDPPGRTGPPPALARLPGQLPGPLGRPRDGVLPGLLDDSQHSAPLPLPSPAALRPVDREDTQRRKKPGRRRVLGWLVGLAAASTAGTFGFREWHRRRAVADLSAAEDEVAASRAALYAGDIRKARTLAEHALELSPESTSAARAIVDARALDVLDGGVAPDAAVDVVTTARRLKVEGVGLAVATLSAAVGARNAEHAKMLIEQHQRQDVGADDAVHRLALGAAYDLLADAGAVDAYAEARKLAPEFSSAVVRHVRALVFAGRAGEARTAAKGAKLPDKTRNALAMLLVRAERPERWPDTDARIVRDDVGDLPRPLRAIGAALALVPPDEKGAASMGLEAALDDADSPGSLLLCGQLALSAKDLDSALQAGERAASMAPAWTPAHALRARVFLLRGQLDEALALEPSLPPAVSAELRAIAAYESGDPEALAEAESRAVEKGAARWPALALALGRLRSGSKRPGAAESDALLNEGVPWADVLAVDFALDAGDIDRARKIVKTWADKPDPSRALRLARLKRIGGDLPGAAKALLAAGDQRWAKLEAILLAAESKAERKKASTAMEEQIAAASKPGAPKPGKNDLGVLSPFALAYLRGRDGAFQAAKSALGKSKVEATGPLEARALTLLALAASRDTGQAKPFVDLVEVLRGRPEIIWAGVMLGTLPPTKMPKGMK